MGCSRSSGPLVTPVEGDGGRKPLLPWLESTRLTTSGSGSSPTGPRASASSCVELVRRTYAPRSHLDAAVGAANGAPTPSGVRSPSSASWARRIDAVGRRSNGPWLCSRAVLIAEVDEKRRAGISPFVEGGWPSQPGKPGGRKRRSKPARGGEVARTVADPRGSHGVARRMRELETAVAESGRGNGGESLRPEAVGARRKLQGKRPASRTSRCGGEGTRRRKASWPSRRRGL